MNLLKIFEEETKAEILIVYNYVVEAAMGIATKGLTEVLLIPSSDNILVQIN